MNASKVIRALGYPYDRPSVSFLFGVKGHGSYVDISDSVREAGSARHLLTGMAEKSLHPSLADVDQALSHRRTAVLAIGSNASPKQLARKYPGNAWAPIPVFKAELDGFDIVYAAQISSYGSFAASLIGSEATANTTVQVFVTLLDDAQLRRMHETEGGYFVVKLLNTASKLRLDPGHRCSVEAWAWPDDVPVLAYVARNGVALVEGNPAALSEIPARNRCYPALTQSQAQRKFMQAVSRKEHSQQTTENSDDLEQFVLTNIDNDLVRRKRMQALWSESIIPASEHLWEVAEELSAVLSSAGNVQ